jgi:hypothetical protein
MFEEPARVVFAERRPPPRALPLGHVLDGDQHPVPALLVARQDRPIQLDVEPLTGERVVDGVAAEFGPPIPELRQLLDMRGQHVIAEDAVEVADEMREVRSLEQVERPPVHLEEPDAVRAHFDPLGILAEVVAQRPDPGCPPRLEQGLDGAVILQPQRHRRQVEHLRGVAVFRDQAVNGRVARPFVHNGPGGRG